MRFFRTLVVLLCAAAAAGCGLNPSGSGTGTTLRAINLVPGASPVTVAVGGTTFLNQVPFETIGGYQDITAGTYSITVTVGSATTPAYTASDRLSDVSANTFIAFGPPTLASGVLLLDTLLTHVPSGNFALRLANLSPTAGLVDAYLTAPGADLATVSPIATGIAYGSYGAFVNVPVGTYQLRLARTGTKEVIFDATPQSFADGSGQTVVAYSRGSGRLVNVVLVTTNGPATQINNSLARFKAVNATSVGSPLNVFLDDALTLANLPYAGASNYQTATAATHRVSVEAASTPGATLLTTSPTLAPATDTSIALYGSAGALFALTLADANVSSLTATARVRFVNVAPGIGPLDVYANGTSAATGVAQNAASGYALLDAVADGTAYQFDFDPAGTTSPVLTLPSVSLVAGGVYTIYVMGPTAARQGVVVQDF
jgi:hypothetical protein